MRKETTIPWRLHQLVALVFLMLLLLLGKSYAAQQQNETTDKEKLRRAEQLAERFVQRFAETLDFGVCYKEFFVTDWEKRIENAKRFLPSKSKMRASRKVPAYLFEQFYIGLMNVTYLGNLYDMNVSKPNDGQTLEQKLSPELVKAIKASPYFSLQLKSPCCGEGEEDFKNVTEIKRAIADAKKISALYRKYMPPKPLSSENYKINLASTTIRNTSEITKGNGEFGTQSDTTMYWVTRGLFIFVIIEERGKLRVLTLAFD
jgi:hypothetical protein